MSVFTSTWSRFILVFTSKEPCFKPWLIPDQNEQALHLTLMFLEARGICKKTTALNGEGTVIGALLISVFRKEAALDQNLVSYTYFSWAISMGVSVDHPSHLLAAILSAMKLMSSPKISYMSTS